MGEFFTLPSDVARRIAARRRIVSHACPVCGRAFLATVRAIYDRHSCAVIASRRRTRAAKRKEPHHGDH